MIVGDESQKSMVNHTTNTSSMGMSFINEDSMAMYSKVGSSSGVNQRFKNNFMLVCEFCKCKENSKEFCYKVVGYPPNFKSKRKSQDVNSGQAIVDAGHTQANFSYGMNTNVHIPGKGTKGESYTANMNANLAVNTPNRTNQAEKDVQQLLQGCTFTKDQYDHILHMFQQRSESAGATCNATHSAGNVFFVSENHMVSNLDMLIKESVSKLEVPKTIYHPNGDATQVSHVGSCALSTRNVLTDVFHLPEFKYNLMSFSKITKELGCSVTFSPHFCVFQELYSGR